MEHDPQQHEPVSFLDQGQEVVEEHLVVHRRAYHAFFRVLIVALVGSALVLGIHTYARWSTPIEGFPDGTVVEVPMGASLADVAELMTEKNIVHSPFQLQVLVVMQGGARRVQAGEYYFEYPQSPWKVADRLINGKQGLDPITVTIPEGMTTYQMAELLAEKFGRFDEVTFLERTREREGYLFPDTYKFLPNATIDDIVKTMEENFFTQIATIQNKIDASGRPLHDIVTMASLLEREANTYQSRQVVAGILWNRLEIDMPLQVDAVFGYIYERETFHPRYSHLKVESPYNTYMHKGLPPGPIASPSLSSLEAAVDPIPNDYLFYLTGRDGAMRYSNTYAQHMHNKRAYLD